MLPIKELIAFAFVSIAIIAVTGGPWNFRGNLRTAQTHMLREVGKTSNWGNPLIWHQRPIKPYQQKLTIADRDYSATR